MTATSLNVDNTTWAQDFARSWNDFWFRPADPTLGCLLRIGLGIVALLHLGSYSGDLVRWFAADGLLPGKRWMRSWGAGTFHPTYLTLAPSPTSLWILHACGVIAAASLTLGLFSRTSAAITAIATLAIANRAPVISGQVEPVLIFMLLYLSIAPAGARFSLDALLIRPMLAQSSLNIFVHRDEPSFLATLSLRLMQVHLAAFYLMMALSKTYGDAWWDGSAVWHLIAQTHSRPLDLSSLRGSEFLLNAWTHFIVWTQLLFPFLVWHRFTRPVVLAAAAVLWLSMLPLTGLTSFCLLMLIATG